MPRRTQSESDPPGPARRTPKGASPDKAARRVATRDQTARRKPRSAAIEPREPAAAPDGASAGADPALATTLPPTPAAAPTAGDPRPRAGDPATPLTAAGPAAGPPREPGEGPTPHDKGGREDAEVPPRPSRPIWKQLDEEHEFAYGAARHFFEQGPARQPGKTIRECGLTPELASQWMSQHRWIERARAYDEHIALVRQQEPKAEVEDDDPLVREERWLKRREELRQRDWGTAALLHKLSENILKSELRQPSLDYKPRDMIKLIDLASRLSHRAVADPAEADSVGGISRRERRR